jgi:FkbM family methyltransferase
MDIYFFQIGSHIGNTVNDHIFSKETKNKNIILIEPVPYYFHKLRENYAEKSQNNHITYMNVAVSNSDSMLDLYVPSLENDFSQFPPWASQLSSCVESHIPIHCPNLKTEKISVPCYRIGTIMRDMSINHIEFLLVDTEGHDYDILMDLVSMWSEKQSFSTTNFKGDKVAGEVWTPSVATYETNEVRLAETLLDLGVVKPSHIIFENKHMDGVCCRGEKYRVLMARFADAGYRVFCEDGEDTHLIMDYSRSKCDETHCK